MQLKDIIAKVLAGETLDDAHKEFLKGFDLQSQLDAAASASRKKAEGETKKAQDALAALQAQFDEFKTANDPANKQTEIQKLTARIDKLEKAKQAAEDKLAASERNSRVRELAKAAGINPAKGVDSKTIDLLVDNLMNGVDLDDADAVKTAFDGFKTANAALIAAGTIGGAGAKGTPGAGAFTGANPFSKKTFNVTKQIELAATNPDLAKSLKDAAASEG